MTSCHLRQVWLRARPGWAFLAVSLAFLAACGGGATGPASSTGDLSGTVREPTRATPVAGAVVAVGTRNTTTAADGTFELTGLPVGAATLRVTAPGYEPFEETVSLQAGANQRDVPLAVKTLYEFGQFAAYIPPFVETLRGVLLVIGGFGNPSVSLGLVQGNPSTELPHLAAYHPAIRSFAATERFAILGEDVPRETVPNGSALVQPALTALASAVSHHPELQHAPVLLLGLSWGGCKAYEHSAAAPGRVIAFITVKGGCHPTSSQPSAHSVPGYLFIGGNDTPDRSANITTAFVTNRSSGALWALAVEPGAEHTPVADVGLVFHWMATVVQLRLPDQVPPGQPVVLRAIDESNGWLGNRETFEIGAYAAYGGNRGDAAWLPSMAAATRWATLVSGPE